MIGWLFMLGMAVIVFAGLWALGGMKRPAFEFVAAALVLGFAGYQWQGRPGLPGASEQPIANREEVTASLIQMRNDMDRNFTTAKRYIVPSDSYAREGDYEGAVQILRGGLKRNPRDADLWVAVALQLMIAADGTVPPAAKLAFDRARAADPRHPGPAYFTGLAALRNSEPEQALILWTALVQGDYRAGPWRDTVATQADALGQMLGSAMASEGLMGTAASPPASAAPEAAAPAR